jgi:hypothetical protein
MFPSQLKDLQELRQLFSQGKANPKQIQQLSLLLVEINNYEEGQQYDINEEVSFITAPRLY